MATMKYLAGYPLAVQAQVRNLIDSGRLGEWLANKYGTAHDVRTDKALYAFTLEKKERHLRSAGPLHKVVYDNRLQVVKHALGTHTTVSRVQGGKLKASREIRIASLFRDAPAAFLDMIVVHELAHLRQSDHNKAFYQLCSHMAPDYHQLEFDVRVYLTHLECSAVVAQPGAFVDDTAAP